MGLQKRTYLCGTETGAVCSVAGVHQCSLDRWAALPDRNLMGDPQDCNEPEVSGGHAIGLLKMSVSGPSADADVKRREHTVAVRARRTRGPCVSAAASVF